VRVSQYFKLGRTQPSLDFVDVDVFRDIRVFIDPRALRLLPSKWGDECVSLIQTFFRTVLGAIRDGDNDRARNLLRTLKEPNETHLGLSRTKARGRALGPESAHDVWDSLSKSEAVKSGLLEDLEDTILMVEGIDVDIVSDITTNIIREPLIRYTQDACEYYNIPYDSEVDSGPLWDPFALRWYSELIRLPVTKYGKLLLVPKVIVRAKMNYNQNEYYRHYILEHLKEVELSANSELVQLLKNGKRRVTIKDLKNRYGQGKAAIVRETRKNPVLLQQYRSDKRKGITVPLSHIQIAEVENSPEPDWDSLLAKVMSVPVGNENASSYEKSIEALLTALFYPSLTNPQIQHEIHEGRKRIDITYTNVASIGFFRWLAQHYSAPHVYVECKNYGTEIGNPELDQIAGRFSPSRGQFGLLICRGLKNKNLMLKRCRDTAQDGRGFIIPIVDADLKILVHAKETGNESREFHLLKQQFDKLIM